MNNKLLSKSHITLNEGANGGEAFILTTQVFGSGDAGEVHISQKLTLQSYANSATFYLDGSSLTPKKLREVADLLEVVIEKARKKTL